MGFGAYDESEHEKRNQNPETIDEENYENPGANYSGEVTFEYGEAEEDEEAINEMLENLKDTK